MLKEPILEKRSTIVQIMNEVDNLTDDEKSFVLYWLRAKKNSTEAAEADLTVKSNNISPEDIYTERDILRQQKVK